MGSPRTGFWRELCGMVAEYRNKKRGAHALAGLVAAHVLGGDPETAVARLDALRHAEARRTNYRRESVFANLPRSRQGQRRRETLMNLLRMKDAAAILKLQPQTLRGLRSRGGGPVFVRLSIEPDRLRRGGPPSVDRVPGSGRAPPTQAPAGPREKAATAMSTTKTAAPGLTPNAAHEIPTRPLSWTRTPRPAILRRGALLARAANCATPRGAGVRRHSSALTQEKRPLEPPARCRPRRPRPARLRPAPVRRWMGRPLPRAWA